MRFVVVFLCASLGILGCSSDSASTETAKTAATEGQSKVADVMSPTSTAPAAALPKGWTRVRSEDGSVSIGLPANWVSSVQKSAPAKGLGASIKPQFAFGGKATGQGMENPIKLLFIRNWTSGHTFTPSGNVTVFPSNGSTAEELAADDKAMLSGEHATIRSTGVRDLPAGRANFIEYSPPLPTTYVVKPIGDYVYKYTFLKNGREVILSISVPVDQLSLVSEGQEITKTLEIR